MGFDPLLKKPQGRFSVRGGTRGLVAIAGVIDPPYGKRLVSHLDDRRNGIQLAGRQLCGSNSSMQLFNWVGSLVRTCLR